MHVLNVFVHNNNNNNVQRVSCALYFFYDYVLMPENIKCSHRYAILCICCLFCAYFDRTICDDNRSKKFRNVSQDL